MPAYPWRPPHEIFDFTGTPADAMTDTTPTSTVAPESSVKPEDVIEVLRQCYDPEIPVNIVDLGLIYDIAIKPERVDIKMTLTALGCPMAADVMADVRDHLLTLPGISDAGVDIVYEPVWTPERMSEEARWELGMV
jgi:metal-sulfur cluster biosynthetic enzyme